MEVIVPLLQRREEIIERLDRAETGRPGEFFQVGIESGGLVDDEGLVRSEGRINPGLEAGLPDALMRLQRVCRVIRRADDRDLVGRQNVVHAHGREFRIGRFPDLFRRGGIDDGLDPKVALQLEMRPVVERVAQRRGHGGAPRGMLFPRRGVAGAQALGHAVRAQGAPLVVVAAEPDLAQVGEPVVVGDLRRRQVTVVIVDRLRLRVGVVEIAGGGGLQEKVVVNKWLHRSSGV